jgi:hypothetical protein
MEKAREMTEDKSTVERVEEMGEDKSAGDMVEEKSAKESVKKTTPGKVLGRWPGRVTSRKWSRNELVKKNTKQTIGERARETTRKKTK